MLITLVTGLLTGALTSLGQTWLPEPLVQFANSLAVWLLASFFVGWWAVAAAGAGVAGFAVLVIADVAFYLGMYLQFGIVGSWAGDLAYLLGGLVAGPAFGVAGFVTRSRSRYAGVGAALLGAVFLAEAGLRATSGVITSGYASGWPLFAGAGVLAIVVTLPWTRKHPLGLLAAIPCAVLGLVGLTIVIPAALEVF